MTKIVIASNWGREPFNSTFHLTSHAHTRADIQIQTHTRLTQMSEAVLLIPVGLFELCRDVKSKHGTLTGCRSVCINQDNMHLACANTHKRTPDTGVAVCIITPAPLLPSHSMWDKSITRWRGEAGETHTAERGRTSGGCESLPRHSGLGHCQSPWLW